MKDFLGNDLHAGDIVYYFILSPDKLVTLFSVEADHVIQLGHMKLSIGHLVHHDNTYIFLPLKLTNEQTTLVLASMD